MANTIINSDALFTYPTPQDWARIESQFDWKRFYLKQDDLSFVDDNSLASIETGFNLPSWIVYFNNRINDLNRSYIFLSFYHEQGIPDSKWWIQDKGSQIFFPDFEDKHHLIKSNFDYYADVFYYKMFSAWDILGQIMNLVFKLGLGEKLVTFEKSHDGIKSINVDAYDKISLLINEIEYKKAKRIRNALAHRYSPMEISPPINKTDNDTNALTVGKYTPSTEIKDNATAMLDIFAKAIESIKSSA